MSRADLIFTFRKNKRSPEKRAGGFPRYAYPATKTQESKKEEIAKWHYP